MERTLPESPYSVCLTALQTHWTGQASPEEIVGWMFDALDVAGDVTVPRTPVTRHAAELMTADVMADLGDPTDMSAVVANVLRVVREIEE